MQAAAGGHGPASGAETTENECAPVGRGVDVHRSSVLDQLRHRFRLAPADYGPSVISRERQTYKDQGRCNYRDATSAAFRQ
jgi:hypothetical protein